MNASSRLFTKTGLKGHLKIPVIIVVRFCLSLKLSKWLSIELIECGQRFKMR